MFKDITGRPIAVNQLIGYGGNGFINRGFIYRLDKANGQHNRPIKIYNLWENWNLSPDGKIRSQNWFYRKTSLQMYSQIIIIDPCVLNLQDESMRKLHDVYFELLNKNHDR